jgi:hypothetical protein
MQLDDIEALNYDDLGSVAKLSNSGVYKDIMEVRVGPCFLKKRAFAQK